MPTISIFYGIVVQMFWREHNPAHFHATYGGEEVIIAIADLSVIEGELPRRAMRMVLAWARAHRKELLEDWDLCQRKQHPKKIAPLR